jgi:hypothetical protein
VTESADRAALRVRLAALVQQWREDAAVSHDESEEQCADELAAVLQDDQEARVDRRGDSAGFGTAKTDREG